MKIKGICRATIVVALATLAFACRQKNSSNTVALTVHGPLLGDSSLVITATDFVRLGDDTLQVVQLDSVGHARAGWPLAGPMFVKLHIGKDERLLFLEPGHALSVAIDSARRLSFAGEGAVANRVLQNMKASRDHMLMAPGKDMYRMEHNAYMHRTDSLTALLRALQSNTADSLSATEKTFLDRYTRYTERQLKQTFYWNSASAGDASWQTEEKEFYKRVDWDTLALTSRLLEYAIFLHMRQYKKLYIEPFQTKTKADSLYITQYPVEATQAIVEQDEAPEPFRELFFAKNFENWLSSFGLTPEVDSLYVKFKGLYPHSPHLAVLEKSYGRWVDIGPGKPAPEIVGRTLAGDAFSSRSLQGKVVYVDVWATWCAPCREEIPYAKKLQARFAKNKDLVFLNVSVDGDITHWQTMLKTDKHWGGLHIHQFSEQHPSIYKSYLIWGIPRFILIGRDGKIVSSQADRPSSETIAKTLDALLAGKGT